MQAVMRKEKVKTGGGASGWTENDGEEGRWKRGVRQIRPPRIR